MTVLRINAVGWLTRPANIEAVWNLDVHMLIGVFCDARTNNREILFFDTAGSTCVDECGGAGPEVVIPDEPFGDFFGGWSGLGHAIS
jgi:hypothetical protein